MHWKASGGVLLLFSALFAAAPALAQTEPGDEIEEVAPEDEGDEEESPPPAEDEAAPEPPPPPVPLVAPATKTKINLTPPKRALERIPHLEAPAPEPVPTEADLARHIERRAEYVRLADRASADVELAFMEEMRQKLGARNVIVSSAALINEAKLALEAKDNERAIELVEAAAELSPDLVSAHWMRARVYMTIDWTQISAISRALSDLFTAQLGQFRNVLSLLSRFLMLFGMAVLGTVVAFTLVQGFKYLRYPAHDFASLWPRFMGTGEMVLVLLLLLSLPMVLGMGIGITAAATIALIYAYQTRRERIVSTAILLLLAVGPGIVYLAAPLVTFHGSITDAMATAVSEAFASDAEMRLRHHAEHEGKGDYETAMVLAHLKRRRGELAGAEVDYQSALGANPTSAYARSNLGTIFYLMGKKEAAQAAFQQAATGEIAEPFLNLASLAAEAGDFDKAKEHLERARTIDEPLTNYYTTFNSSVPTSQKLLEAQFDQRILWRRIFDADSAQSSEVAQQVWRSVAGWLPTEVSSMVMLGLLLLGVILLKRSDRLSVPCPKCGIPADRGSPAQYCGQCHSVFLTAVAVEPSLRRRKEHEVRRFQVRRRWVERALVLFAGSSQVYSGSPILGVILMFLFLLLTGNVVLADYLSVHPWSVWIDSSAAMLWSIASAGVAVLFVLISLRATASQR
jgi:Tfp pilus assembly protein PilF